MGSHNKDMQLHSTVKSFKYPIEINLRLRIHMWTKMFLDHGKENVWFKNACTISWT